MKKLLAIIIAALMICMLASCKKDDNKKETSGILDLLGNFDPDKLADGLNGVKKILAVLGEVTKPEENEYVTKRKMTRPYQRSDD